MPTTDNISPIRQYGVLAYRRGAGLQILLITSRETKRWVIPRGNPIDGLAPQQSALREAFEEAGVEGVTAPGPIGRYRYEKRLKDGGSVPAEVLVFPMEVTEERSDWPERAERDRKWFDASLAAELVDEQGLKDLIGGFRPAAP